MTTLAVRPHQVCLGCLILDFLPYVSENAEVLLVIESYGQILVKETRRSDAVTDPPFAPFARSVQAALGSAWPANLIFSNFIVALDATIQVALESPDDLINLFNSFEKMVLTVTARPEQEGMGADTCSALGFFLRKLTIDFSSLSFEHVCQLLDSLQRYFYPNNWRSMNGNKLYAAVISEEEAARGRQAVIYNDDKDEEAAISTIIAAIVRSGPELQRFVRAQTEQFEHQISTQDQQSLEANLHTIIASSLSTLDAGGGGAGGRGVPRSLKCPEIHQALFTSATLHKDPAAALEHLHSYFDHWPQAGQDMDDNKLNSLVFLGPPAAPVVNRLSQDTTGSNNNNSKRQGAAAATSVTAAVQKRQALQERSQLQHATLALATVHARLGHVVEAMQALNETVRIAQQRGDDGVLVNALAILCQIMDMTTPGTITGVGDVISNAHSSRIAAAIHYSQLRGLLKRLLHRARQMKMPHLVAYATLAMASSEFTRRFDPVALGKKVPPVGNSSKAGGGGGGGFTLPHTTTASNTAPTPTTAATWSEHLFKECEAAINTGFAVQDIAHLDLASSLAAATPIAPPAPSVAGSSAGNASARILRGVADLFTVASDIYGPALSGSEVLRSCAQEVGKKSGSALLLRSACWAVCGNTRLAKAQALAYIHAHPHTTTNNINNSNNNNNSCTTEETLVAYAQLAASIAAESGPAAALPLLETVTDTLFPSSSSSPSSLSFQCTKLAISHDRALHLGDLALAQQISAEMTALASPTDATDISLRLEGEIRVVKTILAVGDYPAAARAAACIFDVAQNTGQPMYAARLLVLLGKIHLRGGAAGVGLRYLESAREEGRLMRLDVLEAEAAVLAAEAWCEVATAENDIRKKNTRRTSSSSSSSSVVATAAQREIESLLPAIRSYGNLELKSDALLTLAIVMSYKHKNDGTLVVPIDKDTSNGGDGKRMVDALTEAAAGYMLLEDGHHAARAMRLKALVLDAMGDVGGRNVAAGEYKRLCMEMKMNC